MTPRRPRPSIPMGAHLAAHTRSAALLCALALLICPALRADEQSEDADPRDAWQPGIEIGFGLHSQNLDGTMEADLPVASGGTVPIGRGSTNDLLGQHFTPALSLDTPVLGTSGLQPRLFIHGGGQLPLSDDHIARRYIGTFSISDPDLADNCPGPIPQSCIVRAKNRLRLEGGWYAGLGIDIKLPITVLEKRNFHLRTSIDYYGQSWDSKTVIDRNATANPGPVDTREVIRSASDEKVVHGLGPRLQLALQLAEWGPLRWDIYLRGQFYWLLSDNDIRYTGSSPDGNSVSTTKADPYVAQGGAGLRIVWKGY